MSKSILKRSFTAFMALTLIFGSAAAIPSSAENVSSNYSVTLAASLSTPKIKSYKSSSSAVKITWGKVSGASGYRVYRYVDGKWKNVATIKSAKTLSYKITGLEPVTKYKFKVKAYKKSSDGKVKWSSASATFTAKTKEPDYTVYEKVLKTNSIYRLLDINSDGIKELLVYNITTDQSSDKLTKCFVYTYNGGSPKKVTYITLNSYRKIYDKSGKLYLYEFTPGCPTELFRLKFTGKKITLTTVDNSFDETTAAAYILKKYGASPTSFYVRTKGSNLNTN